jgi:hypothetical protein
MLRCIRILLFTVCFFAAIASAQTVIVKPLPPGPAWIPATRCNPSHTRPLTDDDFAALASMAQFRQPPSPIEDIYDRCFVVPAGVAIPLTWWEYQFAEHCGDAALNIVRDDGARLTCWANRWRDIDTPAPNTPRRELPSKPTQGRMIILPAMNWPIRFPLSF